MKNKFNDIDKRSVVSMKNNGMTYSEITESFILRKGEAPSERTMKDWIKEAKLKEDMEKIKISELTDNVNTWFPYVLEGLMKNKKIQNILFNEKIFKKIDDVVESKYEIIFKTLKEIANRNECVPSGDMLMAEYNLCSSEKIKEYCEKNKTDITETKTEVDNAFIEICHRNSSKDFIERYVRDYIEYESQISIVSAMNDIIHKKKEKALQETMKLCKDYFESDLLDLEDCGGGLSAFDLLEKDDLELKTVPFFAHLLNSKMDGFPAGVSCLVAGTGTGKTWSCINEEIYLARKGIASIHYAVGDMTALQLYIRFLTNLEADWNIKKELKKQLASGDKTLLTKLIRKHSEIFKYITVVPTDEIGSINTAKDICDSITSIVKNKQLYGEPIPQFVAVDYDENIESKQTDVANKMEEIYRTFQKYGLANGISILVVSQTVKIINPDDDIKLNDIAGGEKKKRISSNIISLTKKTNTNGSATIVSFAMCKVRDGEFVNDTEQMIFDNGGYYYASEEENRLKQKDFDSKIENNEWIGD